MLGAGVLLVFFAPSGWLALLGFAMMGVSIAVIFPLAMSAAARADPHHRKAERPGADHGIRWSFGIGLPLVILSIVCVGALGTRPLKHEVE